MIYLLYREDFYDRKKSPLGTIVDQNVYVGRDSLDNKLTTRKEVKNLIEDIAAPYL